MKKKYTIGQMSNLNNIPVKTLRYYDEIGLFVPYEVDQQTGYRYYSIEQFKKLDMISFLKSMGVPLGEIKRKVEHSTADEFVQVLTEYKWKNESRIEDLSRMNRLLQKKIDDIECSKGADMRNRTIIKSFPERSIIKVPGHFGRLDDIEGVLRKLKKEVSPKSPIMVGTVGRIVSQKDVWDQELVDYSAVFITVDENQEETHEKRIVLEQGTYATTYIDYEDTRQSLVYRRILDSVRDQGYKPEGPFYIRTIVESFISHKEEEHTREIQIKVNR